MDNLSPCFVPASGISYARPKIPVAASTFSWQWRHLKQSCRPDLKISHWERIPKNEGSKNVEIRAQNVEGEAMKIDLVATETGVADTATEKDQNVVEYSADEYHSILESGEWSKEETDYLFDLCRRFGRNFIVISDRYEYVPSSLNEIPSPTKRSYEEILARFFDVSKKILEYRNPLPSPDMKNLIDSFSFNLSDAIERRNKLSELYSRSAKDIEDEMIGWNHLKKMENELISLISDKDQLRKLLQPNFSDYLLPLNRIISETQYSRKKSRKHKSLVSSDFKLSIKTASSKKKKDVGPSSASSSASTPTVQTKKEKKGGGVLVRSQTLTMPKSHATQQKVTSMLEELGVPIFPKMPTQKTCQHYQELTQSILSLLDIKKHAERLENELHSLKQHRTSLEPNQTTE